MAENSTDLVDCSGLDIPNDKFKIFYVVILVADLAVLFGGLAILVVQKKTYDLS